MAMSEASYGPSALATPANAITVLRVLCTLPLVMMVVDKHDSWAATALWVILCLTDGIDGYLARRQGATRSGAFLDPLADKILVLGALFALVGAGSVWWLPVALISVREVAISLFRSFWARRGLAVPARKSAKVKTIVQQVAVGLALLPLTASHPLVYNTVLWVAVALTLATGFQYVHEGSRATRSTGALEA